MLDQTDIDRVSAYIYEGFPELKGAFSAKAIYPSQIANLDDHDMLDHWLRGEKLLRAPRGLARISNIFTLAREFVGAADIDVGRKGENLRDAVATACVLSLEGREAKHALTIIRDSRLSAGKNDPLRDTGMLMLYLTGDKAFPGTMNAKEALEHAERLYDSYNPVGNKAQTPALAY